MTDVVPTMPQDEMRAIEVGDLSVVWDPVEPGEVTIGVDWMPHVISVDRATARELALVLDGFVRDGVLPVNNGGAA